MRAAGIRHIASVSSADSLLDGQQRRAEELQTFCATVPDQRNHLEHCGQLLGVQSVPALCEALGYTGAPEDLSMWLCLFAGKGLEQNYLGYPRARALACHWPGLLASRSMKVARVSR
jgi:hypothetical protein